MNCRIIKKIDLIHLRTYPKLKIQHILHYSYGLVMFMTDVLEAKMQ